MAISRILGIDYGSVRIGLALSDPLKIISKPFQVIPNNGSDTLLKLAEVIRDNAVDKIVLGLPLDKDGSDSAKTIEVREFAESLKRELNMPVILWDERYTTAQANSWLKELGVDYKKSKTVIDKIAAAIILKDYLDARK